MDILMISLLLLVILLVISLVLASLLYSRNLKDIVESVTETKKGQLDLLNKLTGLLAAKDPMAYQAIQAMDSPPMTRTPFPEDKDVSEEDLGAHYRSQFPLDEVEEGDLSAVERSLLSES